MIPRSFVPQNKPACFEWRKKKTKNENTLVNVNEMSSQNKYVLVHTTKGDAMHH